MKKSLHIIVAVVGLAAISATSLAQNGRGSRDHNRRNDRNSCAPSHRDRGSNVSVAFSVGSSRGYYGARYGNSWGGNRGHHRSSWGVWAGSRSNRYFSNWDYGDWRGSSCRPAVVYTAPVVRRRPVIVERPVVIERPVYRQPVYQRTIIREVPVYRDIVAKDPATRYQPGWDAIKADNFAYARKFFTNQALLRPDDPTAKAGLAIARAAGGLDSQAESAMRRAVREGVDRARQGLPAFELEEALVALDEHYAERSDVYNDRWFMLAATRYLIGDFAGAKDAADQALSFDEGDAEARRIYDLVTHTG